MVSCRKAIIEVRAYCIPLGIPVNDSLELCNFHSVSYVIVAAMNFEYSPKAADYVQRVSSFMAAHVYPNESAYAAEIMSGDRWKPSELIEDLKDMLL